MLSNITLYSVVKDGPLQPGNNSIFDNNRSPPDIVVYLLNGKNMLNITFYSATKGGILQLGKITIYNIV